MAAKRLYYYTAKQWAMKSLWEKRLKIAEYKDLNDPFELVPFKQTLTEARERNKLILRVLSDKNGVLCFSERWSTALMWAHYGDKHRGVVLGFDVEEGEWLTKIDYASKRLESTVDFKTPFGDAQEAFLRTCLNVKSSTWKYEREYRLRSTTHDRIDGIAYSKFGLLMELREVVIGARCTLTVHDVVDALGQPEEDVKIRKVRPAHASFTMVDDKEFAHKTVAGLPPELKHQRALAEALMRYKKTGEKREGLIKGAMSRPAVK